MTAHPDRALRGSQTDSREPIRILFVSHDSGLWGAQRALLTLISAMDRRLFNPMLLIPYDGPMARLAAEVGVPVFVKRLVHWIPGPFVSTRKKRFRYFCRFIKTLNLRCKAIEKLIVEKKVDFVYTNTLTCVEGAIASRRTRRPHIWHIHEHILRNSELVRLLPNRLYSMFVDFLSGSVIFCSRALAKDYPELFNKAFIVYNGLLLPPVRDRDVARAELTNGLGIDADAKLVAVVGTLHSGKDYLTFLEAAKQVARRVEDAFFLVVGSGSEDYTNLIRQRVSDLQLNSRVRFLGWRDDVQDILPAIDVLVISSEQESFGLTAIEALSVETPVVATRCGGPEEVVVDGDTGLLVPVKNSRAMADAIVRLLVDREFARRMGVRGRSHVSEHFGVERYIQRIQWIIQKEVASQGKELAAN